ncbi:MAG: YARHG domain-containing protein [Alloprevotella sp.]|nr:YARHG domain-containing protein [Alloprevotella sp.]
MKRFLLFFLGMLPLCLGAQNIENGSLWFDGFAQYRAIVSQGGKMIQFTGGTPHEGGYDFRLKRTAAGKYELLTMSSLDEFTPVGEPGSAVERVVDKGVDALIVRNADGTVRCLLERTELSGYDNLLRDNVSVLSGSYSEEQVGFLGHGEQYVIGDAKCRLGERKPFAAYKFMDVYDMPSNVVEVNGELRMLVPTILGMNIYSVCSTEDGDDYEKVGEATPVYWSDHSKGRFCIASERLLNMCILARYSREALRLMRNEILARHGYKFRSEDLSDYFFKQSWYKPAESNEDIKLSAVEELNISLIRAEEARPDEERLPDMEE